MPEENTQETQPSVSNKKRSVYCFLALFGLLGIHNLYIGRYIQGVLQLLIGLFLFTKSDLYSILPFFIPMCMWIICNVVLTETDGKGRRLQPSGQTPRVIISTLICTAAIIVTIISGNLEISHKLKNYNSTNSDLKGPPLYIAIRQNNVTAVKELLKNSKQNDYSLFFALCKLNFINSYDGSYYYDHGSCNITKPTNLEILNLLLKAGSNPNTRHYDYSPLEIAISKNEIETIKLLIQYGADVNDFSGNQTPLMRALKSDNPPDAVKKIVEVLLDSGADINKQDLDGRNVLYYVRDDQGNNSQLIEMLIKKGANPDAKDKYGRTMFMNAANRGKTAHAMKMLELGADIYATDNDGFTVLDVSHSSMTSSTLLRKGVKEFKEGYKWINPKNMNEKQISKYWKNVTLDKLKQDIQNASIIIERSMENDFSGHIYDHIFMHLAAWCVPENYETAQADSQDVKNTLLLNATRYNASPEIIKYLIEWGADVNTRDQNYMTPIMWASFDDANVQTLELLVKSGAKINARTKNGWSALHYSILTGNKVDIIKKLVELGADVNVENQDFLTPADLAAAIRRRVKGFIEESVFVYLEEIKAKRNLHLSGDLCIFSREKGYGECWGWSFMI